MPSFFELYYLKPYMIFRLYEFPQHHVYNYYKTVDKSVEIDVDKYSVFNQNSLKRVRLLISESFSHPFK